MSYACPICNMEKGVSAKLVEDSERGELVCPLNPKHRFKLGKSGFLEPVPGR